MGVPYEIKIENGVVNARDVLDLIELFELEVRMLSEENDRLKAHSSDEAVHHCEARWQDEIAKMLDGNRELGDEDRDGLEYTLARIREALNNAEERGAWIRQQCLNSLRDYVRGSLEGTLVEDPEGAVADIVAHLNGLQFAAAREDDEQLRVKAAKLFDAFEHVPIDHRSYVEEIFHLAELQLDSTTPENG